MNEVLHRIGLLRVVMVGETYKTAWFRVTKRNSVLFASRNEESAVAYAKGSTDKTFLHNHIQDKLTYCSNVTNTNREELIKYFVADGLNRLKRNHYKLTYNNYDDTDTDNQ
jgi:hypothetical protein